MMKVELQFIGARDTVTGSCTHVRLNGRSLLVDCGLFQGPKEVRERNRDKFPLNAKEIDAIFLTHAHLDHTGYLPRLVKAGFSGNIYASQATVQLCRLLLMDAAYLEEEFARFANESGYSNHSPAKPLFTREDVEKTLKLFKGVKRHEWLDFDGYGARFHRAGHIPGASYVELSFTGQEKPQRILFTGDVGNDRLMTMRAPEAFPETEVMVMESTYGNRMQPRGDTLEQFASVINESVAKEGVLVIPAFAVGRAQEIIYLVKVLERQKRIPEIPVILDSPMSIEATSLFLAHPEDHRIDISDLASGDGFTPKHYEISATTNDSMLATMRDGPLIVISAAGMLSGGRILHHLKHRLPHEENTVLFTGYQAEGSKGRYLQDNAQSAKTLRIHHKEIELNATVKTLDCLSSHADYVDLLEQLGRIKNKPQRILLNHGAPNAQKALCEKISKETKIQCETAFDSEGHMITVFHD
jgi:metallo-beta-lactamase family protein